MSCYIYFAQLIIFKSQSKLKTDYKNVSFPTFKTLTFKTKLKNESGFYLHKNKKSFPYQL